MSILNVNKINPVGGGSTITIAGIASVTGNVTATAFVGDGSNLTGIDATKIENGNTKVETIDTGSDGHIKFTTEGGERLRIQSDGDVGIGTINNTNNERLRVQDDASTSTSCQVSIISGSAERSILNFGDKEDPNIGRVSYHNNTNTISLFTNNTERLLINSDGYVTKPSQPMVGCRGFSQNGSTVFNDGNNIIALRFHHIDVNVGNHFNNTTGIFTCPVDGNYFISCQSNLRATDNAWSSVYIIYKPSGGSAQKLSDNWFPSSVNNTWSPIAASHLCNCNAGDELSMAYSAGYSAPSNSSTSGGVQMSIFLFG